LEALREMADQATQHMVIGASPQRIWDVLTDFDSYPTWARDLKSATVVARDDEGRPLDVAFRAAAMGRSTSYTLRYDYGKAPDVLAWRLLHGDITRKLDGSYELAPVDGDPDRTEVTYHLEVDLMVPIPGFVKRRAEARIVTTALRDLRSHLER
jgi:ribosome-associated toxin RatA of RatAB toxin-antitoxin module